MTGREIFGPKTGGFRIGVCWMLCLLGYRRFADGRGSPMTLTSSCCTLTTGSCRAACEEISLVDLATSNDDRWRYIAKLTSLCSQQLVPFWSCMNETLNEIDKGQGFFGRPCCTLPQSQACIMVCLQARDREELTSACRPSDEVTFYTCLERHEAGRQCCGQAESAECSGACKELFSSSAEPTAQLRSYATKTCGRDNARVARCVRNFTLVTPARDPARNLHCCDRSADAECRLACRSILRTQTIGQEIVDNLVDGGCGPPLPHDKLWQCFLTSADSREPEPESRLGGGLFMDGAKLQCCFRAATVTCQRLCVKTFSNEWETSWEEFDRQCQYQLAESSMLRCLAEVDEPCEPGCERLSYCTGFNDRPTELFRSCDNRTDAAARHDFALWRQGLLRMPTVDIPLLDIAACRPDAWRTVACALQLKPCRGKAHLNMICRSDCLQMLSECVDRSRLTDGQTPETLCDVLSPPGINSPCTSLAPYLAESRHAQTASDVTHPCKARTCGPAQVCLVDRGCRPGQPCARHRCVTGCRMGAMSQLAVPPDTYVRVPRVFRGRRCHSVCRCSAEGVLQHCVAMACQGRGQCALLGTEIPHQSQYFANCSLCLCFSGELRCASVCDRQDGQVISGSFCSCPNQYDPVCGSNGQTYQNPCLAKCAGLQDMDPGRCADADPCLPHPCGSRKRCLIRRQVCLSVKRKCPQYVCVSAREGCEEKGAAPACDTENEEHASACLLLRKKRLLAHFGKCLAGCQRKGAVCGHDGREYASECAARAGGVSIDHRGPCAPPGDGCSRVSCQPLPSEHCTGVVPPNACCPICGSVLKLIYSQRQLEQVLDAVQTAEPTTLSALASRLQRHVKTAECDLTAYLAPDQAIVVIVAPNVPRPSALQVEGCGREAAQLQSLVEQASPTLVTEFPLSALLGGLLVQPDGGPGVGSRAAGREAGRGWAVGWLIVALLGSVT